MDDIKNPANWKRHTGEQFHIAAPKTGQVDCTFSKYEGSKVTDPYQEHHSYLEREPMEARPNGFGSRDARKRDEFTNPIRALQYKEGLTKELRLQRKISEGGPFVARHLQAHNTMALPGAGVGTVFDANATRTPAPKTAPSQGTNNGTRRNGSLSGVPPPSLSSSASSARLSSSAAYNSNMFSLAGQVEVNAAAAAATAAANDPFRSTTRVPGMRSELPAPFAWGGSSTQPSSDTKLPALFFQTQLPRFLFDFGRPGAVTPICNKCARETFYCPHRVGHHAAVTARRLGSYRPASLVYGGAVHSAPALKPTHGLRSVVEDFRDHSHLYPGL